MELSWDNVLLAFALTLFAGLSTGIGSAIAFLTKKTNKKFLSLSLGFSAGVMIYVSFVEIFPTAQETLRESYSEKIADVIVAISFFAGMGLIAIIDKLIPSYENPHEVKSVECMENNQPHDKKLMRMGIFSALAIGIHNFPEGIAVSVPIFFATGSRKKAFKLSFLSGLSEPLGAIIGFFLIYTFIGINSVILGILFALVAGIMVFISLDELLPTAKEYGAHHLSIYGLVAGMVLMAFSLLLF